MPLGIMLLFLWHTNRDQDKMSKPLRNLFTLKPNFTTDPTRLQDNKEIRLKTRITAEVQGVRVAILISVLNT